MCSGKGRQGITPARFPHSEIPGSKPACGSPRLIAACHVLRRLLVPRHPPHALPSLAKKFAPDRPHPVQPSQTFAIKRALNKCSAMFCWTIQLSKSRLAFASLPNRRCYRPLRRAIHQQSIASGPLLAGSWPPTSGRSMVENTGLEPVTSGLQSRRSPN